MTKQIQPSIVRMFVLSVIILIKAAFPGKIRVPDDEDQVQPCDHHPGPGQQDTQLGQE